MDPIATQRRYYAETAERYDVLREDMDVHVAAIDRIIPLIARIGAESVLDTGCGTGQAMRQVADALPDLRVHGNDPSAELIEVAVKRRGLSREQFDQVGSQRLPYRDGEFDVVLETGVLHHVPDAESVVGEMLRVARKAIFISDENTFGLGRLPARTAKLALAKTRLLDRVNRRRRGGHDWYFTEGDGVAWTYSVFDSLPMIRHACEEVRVIPTGEERPLRHRFPLLFASHCLVAGFKQPVPSGPRGT
jgi:SAM-dependent methyltransferase